MHSHTRPIYLWGGFQGCPEDMCDSPPPGGVQVRLEESHYFLLCLHSPAWLSVFIWHSLAEKLDWKLCLNINKGVWVHMFKSCFIRAKENLHFKKYNFSANRVHCPLLPLIMEYKHSRNSSFVSPFSPFYNGPILFNIINIIHKIYKSFNIL